MKQEHMILIALGIVVLLGLLYMYYNKPNKSKKAMLGDNRGWNYEDKSRPFAPTVFPGDEPRPGFQGYCYYTNNGMYKTEEECLQKNKNVKPAMTNNGDFYEMLYCNVDGEKCIPFLGNMANPTSGSIGSYEDADTCLNDKGRKHQSKEGGGCTCITRGDSYACKRLDN